MFLLAVMHKRQNDRTPERQNARTPVAGRGTRMPTPSVPCTAVSVVAVTRLYLRKHSQQLRGRLEVSAETTCRSTVIKY